MGHLKINNWLGLQKGQYYKDQKKGGGWVEWEMERVVPSKSKMVKETYNP